MMKNRILDSLQELTRHNQVEIVPGGNAAIKSALSILPKNIPLLIPEEGGWLSYKTLPQELGLEVREVKCRDSKISLQDLSQKLSSKRCSAFLYQNPGGYFAEQPMPEIYELCTKNKCLVIMDVSGSIGTKLCDGHYADILVGSFGRWKLIDAQAGGFISSKDNIVWKKVEPYLERLDHDATLKLILEKINNLQNRITFLTGEKIKIMKDLNWCNIVYKEDAGFVVAVAFTTDAEKERIINYCRNSGFPWTEGPRYIRINRPAICIEVKRLEER